MLSKRMVSLSAYSRGRSTAHFHIVLQVCKHVVEDIKTDLTYDTVVLSRSACLSLPVCRISGLPPNFTLACEWRRCGASGLSLNVKDLLNNASRPGRAPSILGSTITQVNPEEHADDPAPCNQLVNARHGAGIGFSEASLRRICRAHGLKPRRVDSLKISQDPEFATKLEDDVGLYLNPREHALLLSVDAKSQVQERTHPGIPMEKGIGQTMTNDYKLNRKATVFAVLDTATVEVYGLCQERYRNGCRSLKD